MSRRPRKVRKRKNPDVDLTAKTAALIKRDLDDELLLELQTAGELKSYILDSLNGDDEDVNDLWMKFCRGLVKPDILQAIGIDALIERQKKAVQKFKKESR